MSQLTVASAQDEVYICTSDTWRTSADRKRYLDGGVGLPVLLAGGPRQTAVRRPLAAVPEPEAAL